MAVKRKAVSNAKVINAVLDAVPQFANTPRAIEGSPLSLEQAYMAISLNKENLNAFYTGLRNVIGDTIVTKMLDIDNPLERFVKDGNFYGNSFYEMTMDILPLKGFNSTPENSEVLRVLKAYPAKLNEVLHTINFEKYVPESIDEVMLKRCFMTEGRMSELADKMFRNLNRSMAYYERQAMKKAFTDAFKFGGIKLHHLDAEPNVSEKAGKDFITALRETYFNFQNPSRDYTVNGYVVTSAPESIYILVSPKIKSFLDVWVQSAAFHAEDTRFLGNVIVMEQLGNIGIDAIMFDEDFPMFMRTLRATYNEFNVLNLYENFFIHSHMSISTSPFVNAIAFTHNTVYDENVTGVTVSTEQEANAKQGNSITMTSVVTGDETNSVYWNVVNFIDNAPDGEYGNGDGTYITDDGELHIGAKEPVGNVITVEAYAQKNNTKIGTKEITIVQ